MKKGLILRGRRWVMCGGLGLLAVASVGTVQAQPADARQLFAIPAQGLPQALNLLSQQIHVSLLIAQACRQGQSQAVQGTFTANEALDQLLMGSGCTYEYSDSHTLVIKPLPKSSRKQQPAGVNQKQALKPEASEPKVQQLEQMTVTGTRIRGGVTASPTITIGAEDIQQEGFTDLGQVIRSVPQNFNGGQNPGDFAGGGNGAPGNYDQTGGSALNLRGLGPDASLTLLNGHRLVYDGFSQAVDISAIPVEAIERLEIVPDGASAIYGSDAVGGVANVILKRDFNGVTLGARYGDATEGGLTTREYTATAGTTWASGGLIATFKDADADPIYARQRSYTQYLFDPYTIYPGSDLRSGLVSLHQSLGDMAELRLDALSTKRAIPKYQGVTADSYYRYTPEVSITLVSPSIVFFLPRDWSLTLSGAYGKDDLASATYLVSTGEGSQYQYNDRMNNGSHSWEIGAEGPLFPVEGGDARLAIGAGARKNAYSYDGDSSNESVRFAYAELDVPFVSPALGIPGVHRLELSAAMRGEDYYTSFGRVTTPKFGVIYDPTADFTFKTSWGKSFKAPTLSQRSEGKYANLYSASAVGASGLPADATALLLYGGNADLGPERARTWSTSLAFHPEVLPGLDAELTWFDIDYTDRVVAPTIYQQALSNPIFANFVDQSPTLEEIQRLLAVYSDGFYNITGSPYDANKVVAIIHNELVNAARQRIKGFDLSGSYRFDLGNGQLTVRGSASWLDSVQTTSAGQPEQTLAGTAFYPARLKGRIGGVWTSGGFTASGFVNYTGGVINTYLATVREKTASFTTLDTTINYSTGSRAGALSGMTFGLSVQNLLDRKPPLYTIPNPNYLPYDSTNYSAIGRFVSVSVSKHW